MGLSISNKILGLTGQKIEEIKLDEEANKVVITCCRDKRRKAIDPMTHVKGTINQYIRRQVKDLPLFGYACVIDIE